MKSTLRLCLTIALFGSPLSWSVALGAESQQPAGSTLNSSQINELRQQALTLITPLPDKMPGGEKDTAALVQLGQELYSDKRLSVNNTISCNSCHGLDNKLAGADGEPTSKGAFGQRGGRNSPTSLNAGFHMAQFWDGRAATLEDQAKGPILNPVEMAMPNEKEVLQRLSQVDRYQTLFAKAFPQGAEKITYDNVARAIAAFERTLITRDRFDDFLKGDAKALSPQELKGLKTFLETGCTTCHNGPALGATTYQKVGLVNAYENAEDLGRFAVTKDADDKLKFKVPSLRNIALTAPYFHDGRVAALDKAVQKMAWMQLGKELTADETASLTAFLRALSDKKLSAK